RHDRRLGQRAAGDRQMDQRVELPYGLVMSDVLLRLLSHDVGQGEICGIFHGACLLSDVPETMGCAPGEVDKSLAGALVVLGAGIIGSPLKSICDALITNPLTLPA